MLGQLHQGHLYGGPVWPLTLIARLQAAQGNLAEAETTIQQAKTEAGEPPFGLSPVWLSLAEAQLARAKGLPEEASAAYQQCVQAAGRAGMRWHQAWVKRDWAEALIAEAKRQASEKARTLLQEAAIEFEGTGAALYVERVRAR